MTFLGVPDVPSVSGSTGEFLLTLDILVSTPAVHEATSGVDNMVKSSN